MKRSAAFLLMLLFLSAMITGCGDRAVVPAKGDFSFSVPEGYSISNITDTQCEIIQNNNGKTVGGIAVTELKLKDLKDKNTKNLLRYLQNAFHKTNRVEFVAMPLDDPHPAVNINMTAYGEDGAATRFVHYFFEKGQGVYHMWFDVGVAEQGVELAFLPMIAGTP